MAVMAGMTVRTICVNVLTTRGSTGSEEAVVAQEGHAIGCVSMRCAMSVERGPARGGCPLTILAEDVSCRAGRTLSRPLHVVDRGSRARICDAIAVRSSPASSVCHPTTRACSQSVSLPFSSSVSPSNHSMMASSSSSSSWSGTSSSCSRSSSSSASSSSSSPSSLLTLAGAALAAWNTAAVLSSAMRALQSTAATPSGADGADDVADEAGVSAADRGVVNSDRDSGAEDGRKAGWKSRHWLSSLARNASAIWRRGGGDATWQNEGQCGLIQQGGLGLALMSATLALPAQAAMDILSPVVASLKSNQTFMSGFLAWLVAQVLKVFTTFYSEGKWDLSQLVGSGGMPSSHAALCVGLTTSVALTHGISDSLFPVCLGFTLIVMYDAAGVRRHAGMQAEVLNKIIEDLFEGHPVSETKLKELLGHTPLQVFAGASVGVLVACLYAHVLGI